MRLTQVPRPLHLLLWTAGLALLLAACARTVPVVQPVSRPSEYSAYLFSAGCVLYYDNQPDRAETIFRIALQNDPGSATIRKMIYNSIYGRLQARRVPLDYFKAYADTLLALHEMDRQMLEMAYGACIQFEDLTQAKAWLELYMKNWTSARAYSSLYYLDLKLEHKSHPELLDKAFSMAGTDADYLNSLGSLYLGVDSTKAESAWLTALRYDGTIRAAANLWDLYSGQHNTEALHKLYASFRLPEDSDRLHQLLNLVARVGDNRSLLDLSDVILNSGDPELIQLLLRAAWVEGRGDILEQSLARLDPAYLTPSEAQLKDYYSALYALQSKDSRQAISIIAKLDGKALLDELLTAYRDHALAGKTAADTAALDSLKTDLHSVFLSASEAQLPWQIKDYLLAYAAALTFDNQPEVSDEIARPCALWYYDNGRATYDTYVWLAQSYARSNEKINQRALLRQAIEAYPNDASLLNWLGYSYVQDGYNLEEAEILIRRALSIEPDSAFYLDSLAWLYYEKNDFATALKYMEIPSQLEKMPSEVGYHIARIYVALERYPEAIPFLQKAIAANDDPEFVKLSEELLQQLTP